MHGNVEKLGNVKAYVSDKCLILNVYPFSLLSVEGATRNKDRNESSYYQQTKNRLQRLYNLLGLGYCNEWQYFLTITFDKMKVDRYNDYDIIAAVQEEFDGIKRKFKDFKYCYIIERHKDGAYHCHGFVSGIGEIISFNPVYVRSDGVKVYPSKSKFIQYGILQKYFDYGLLTVSPIYSKDDVINYCSKYIAKNLAIRSKNGKNIFHSHGLKSFKNVYFHYHNADTTEYIIDHNGHKFYGSDFDSKNNIGQITQFTLKFD